MKSKHALRSLATLNCAIIIFFYCIPDIAKASHDAGGSLTYIHLSGNVYRMHAVFYRDCYGIPPPASISLYVSTANCNVNQNFNMPAIAGTGLEITLPCAGTITTCNGGTSPGMQKWEYEVDITLSAQCSDWLFHTTDCCRNSGVTTVQNPGSEDMYIEAHLNNLNGDNNSPQFINDPLLFACLGQDFHYNNGMFDADGDSLVYHMIAPRSDQNTNVIYMPGYSAQQPFSSSPPITFDYFTGDLFMHPTAVEAGPIVYEILDYRNGVLMGSVMRDVLMYISPCTNQNPTATEMNGTSQQIAYILPNDTICFDIFTDDADVLDTLTLTWNQVIPGATFTTTGPLHPTGTFCWIPSITDVRDQPYMFTAMVRDNNCPINNAGVYSYFIYVTLDSSLILLNTNELPVSDYLFFSPNPADGMVEIHSGELPARLNIYNSLGMCVLKKEFETHADLSGMPAGIYFVEVISKDGKSMRGKLVKE